MVDINVSVDGQNVSAVENPTSVNRGRPVTWHCPPGAFSIRFTGLRRDPAGPIDQGIPEEGPLDGFSINGQQLSGTVRGNAEDGLYLYEIRDRNGIRLIWTNPIGEDENFGGVEVHGPPPRSDS